MTDEPETSLKQPTKDFESYDEAISSWKSPRDINSWIGLNFRYDTKRAIALSETQRGKGKKVPIYSPSEFLKKKSGICVDLSRFAFESLKQVAPSYNPKYLMIEFEPVKLKGNTLRRHWLTMFSQNGQLYFFADSKRPDALVGPFKKTEDFLKEYERYRQRKIISHKVLDSYKKKRMKKKLKSKFKQNGY